MEFFAKLYRVEKDVMVAACDSEVHGRCFEEGEVVLEVGKKFYGTEAYDRDGIIPLLKEATMLNLVGKQIIGLGIELGLLDEKNVMRLGNTVHAQMVRL